MSELKQVNMAENQLVVGSVKVLQDVSGGGVDTLKRTAQDLTNTVSSFTKKQQDYWSSIASDRVITPIEKKTLKKQFAEIETTYNVIIAEAAEKHLSTDTTITTYQTVFRALRTYLYDTLKVFDDMSTNTTIGSYDNFIAYYEDYYQYEALSQALLTGYASATIRTLLDLTEDGSPGELAYYQGYLYRFTTSWEKINAANYVGSYSETTPEPIIGNYFYCGATFAKAEAMLTSSGVLITASGKIIKVNRTFVKDMLYEYTYKGWKAITDHNDYRYILATNDIVAANGTLSQGLTTYFDKIRTDASGEYSKAEQQALDAKASYTSAQTTLNTATEDYEEAKSDLSTAQTNYNNAKTEAETAKEKYGESSTEYAAAKTKQEEAAAALETAEGNYNSAVTTLGQATTAYNEAKENLRKAIEKAAEEGDFLGYINSVDDEPTDPDYGDYYLYNGTTTTTREQGVIYKWQYHYDEETETAYGQWEVAYANDTKNYKRYLSAAVGVVSTSNAGIGVFKTLLAEVIVAQDALLDKIQTSLIELQEDDDGNKGIIQTKDYGSEGTTGFKLDGSTGKIECDNIVAKGGSFTGTVTATSGSFSGSISTGSITGALKSNNYAAGKSGWYLPEGVNNSLFAQIMSLKVSTIRPFVDSGSVTFVKPYIGSGTDQGMGLGYYGIYGRLIDTSSTTATINQLASYNTAYGGCWLRGGVWYSSTRIGDLIYCTGTDIVYIYYVTSGAKMQSFQYGVGDYRINGAIC